MYKPKQNLGTSDDREAQSRIRSQYSKPQTNAAKGACTQEKTEKSHIATPNKLILGSSFLAVSTPLLARVGPHFTVCRIL